MLVEKFGDNVFLLGNSKLIGQSATSKLCCCRLDYGSRQSSSAMRNGIFGAPFRRVTRVSVAPEG